MNTPTLQWLLVALAALLATLASALPQPPPEAFGEPVERVVLNVTHLDLLQALDQVLSAEGYDPPRPTLQDRNIIGPDNRYWVKSHDAPYFYVGRLDRSDGYRCTAALVGPRLAATSRTCIDRAVSRAYLFRPGHDDKAHQPRKWTELVRIYHLPGDINRSNPCSIRDDWAILLLKERFGDEYGYFGARRFDSITAGRDIFTVTGYDKRNDAIQLAQDKVTGKTQFTCRTDEAAPILTDADIDDGMLGSPLWLASTTPGESVEYLYGLASWSLKDASTFTGGMTFIRTLVDLRKEFP